MVVSVVVERFWMVRMEEREVNWQISQVDRAPPALGPYNPLRPLQPRAIR